MNLPYIIAVDFDGTLCENAWPDIGEEYDDVINYILERQKQGAKIILWTNRVGIYLERAVAWCSDRGLIFDAVNENLPEVVKEYGSDGRKIFANEFLDDSAAKGTNRFREWIACRLLLEGVQSAQSMRICPSSETDSLLTVVREGAINNE